MRNNGLPSAASLGELRMPDITEPANLDAQIEALIRKASDCLRQQLDDVRRDAERAREGNAHDAEDETP
jgi:hypothetical protein